MLILVAACRSGGIVSAQPEDWSSIPSTTITLFFPGQSSHQWLLGPDHEDAGEAVAEGESCVSCHEGEEEQLGNAIVSGSNLEPTPIDGKAGTLDLAVQVAYDFDNAYFRFRWRTRNPYPGEAHPFLRFDGREWKPYGGPRLHEAVRKGRHPPIYEDRLSMMIDDGWVRNFAAHGCWITCHQGQREMPKEATAEQVEADPLLGKGSLNKKDVRKYLPSTRTAETWSSTREPDAVAAIKARGEFLDLIQWRAHRSNPIGMGDDFYVLEYRLRDAGKGPYATNLDRSTGLPRFMYDESKYGSRSIRADQIREKPVALVREENAVLFDPAAAWREGDLLPQHVMSRKDARGSAADDRFVRGVWNGGFWTVLWVRRFHLNNDDDKALAQGRSYTFAFAVHDDNVGSRAHHVSFPVTIGFGAEGDIKATRIP
jgi:hypothetical protein